MLDALETEMTSVHLPFTTVEYVLRNAVSRSRARYLDYVITFIDLAAAKELSFDTWIGSGYESESPVVLENLNVVPEAHE